MVMLLGAALTIVLLASRSRVGLVSASAFHEKGNDEEALASSDEMFANCRYGAAPADNDLGEKTAVLSQLGAGWYLTFNYKEPSPQPDNGADFVHMLQVRQKKNGFVYLNGYDISPRLNGAFANYVANRPGDIWIIGNEIDRGPNPDETDPTQRGQGDTFPHVYARAYHEAYNFIKNVDPTAQIAISGLVEVTPGRLQYLDKVWNSYRQTYGKPMHVDVWTMHIYVLPEVLSDGVTPNGIANVALGTDPTLGKRGSGGDAALCGEDDVYCYAEHDDVDIFAEQVEEMRQWMADHGQKEKPLLLTEYSILYPYVIDQGGTCFISDEFGQCFTPDRVQNYMNQTFNYLNNQAVDSSLGYSMDGNRLVQQYMWYSVYTPPTSEGNVSNLVEADLVTLTLLGQNFKDHVASEAPTANLLIDRVGNVHTVTSPGGTASAKLSVTFRNNGNAGVDEPFTVTFYEDAALTQAIGSVDVVNEVFGCASKPYVVSVDWSDLAPGVHTYWVKVDSGDVINETPGDTDNVGSGNVRVAKHGAFMPVVQGLQ